MTQVSDERLQPGFEITIMYDDINKFYEQNPTGSFADLAAYLTGPETCWFFSDGG